MSVGRRAAGGGAAADYVIGLDLDAAQLPGNNSAFVHVKQALHGLRLPGPALVVGPSGARMVGLYW
jgi:hypothetical protein